VLQRRVTERTFKDVNLAIHGLQRAAEILKQLVGSMRPGEQASSVSKAKTELQGKAKKHLAFIQEALDAAPEHREHARRYVYVYMCEYICLCGSYDATHVLDLQ
jgi:hypothetical protein